jgi:hypothetical protein
MGYFDIFKDKSSQTNYSGVGKKAVKSQAKKRDQLRESSGSGSNRNYPKPTKRVKGKLRKRKKKIKSIFDRLKKP